jgi:hypothetical protein
LLKLSFFIFYFLGVWLFIWERRVAVTLTLIKVIILKLETI